MNLRDKQQARELVKEELLRFGTTLPKGGTFTRNPEADGLLSEMANLLPGQDLNC